MKIKDVILALDDTIYAKELYLERTREECFSPDLAERIVANATASFLRINIQELQNIKEHLELCLQPENQKQSD